MMGNSDSIFVRCSSKQCVDLLATIASKNNVKGCAVWKFMDSVGDCSNRVEKDGEIVGKVG